MRFGPAGVLECGGLRGCMRALTEAADQVAAAGTETDLAPYCTPAYIEMEAANCWLQLQEPAKAVPILEQGLASWPTGQERDRGLCLSRLATAHALAGDLEAACCVGQAALTVLRKAHSARILDQLPRLRRQLVALPYRPRCG